MSAHFEFDINNKNRFEKILKKFSDENKDIFFNKRYIEIFEKANLGKISNFLYTDNKNIFFTSNLINKINNDLFDLESVYGYAGYLCNTNDKYFLEASLKKMIEHYKEKNILVFFFRNNPFVNSLHDYESKFLNYLTVRDILYLKLNLGYDYIWNNIFNSKTRNIIRKGSKNFDITISNDKSDFDKLISKYLEYMSLIKSDPYYFFNNDFFKYFYKNLKNNLVIFKAIDKNTNKISGMILVLKQKPYAHYYFSVQFSDDNSVTATLIDISIKYLSSKNFEIYNFGGGISNNVSDSLYRFKKKFASNEHKFKIAYFISDMEKYANICESWKKLHPNLIDSHGSKIMKYRYNE